MRLRRDRPNWTKRDQSRPDKEWQHDFPRVEDGMYGRVCLDGGGLHRQHAGGNNHSRTDGRAGTEQERQALKTEPGAAAIGTWAQDQPFGSIGPAPPIATPPGSAGIRVNYIRSSYTLVNNSANEKIANKIKVIVFILLGEMGFRSNQSRANTNRFDEAVLSASDLAFQK